MTSSRVAPAGFAADPASGYCYAIGSGPTQGGEPSGQGLLAGPDGGLTRSTAPIAPVTFADTGPRQDSGITLEKTWLSAVDKPQAQAGSRRPQRTTLRLMG
jgi:hypothetical protein